MNERQILNPLGMSMEKRPVCFGTNPSFQTQAENCCADCGVAFGCAMESKATSVESRPAVYFSSMTTEELISYAESFAVTAMEKALLAALKSENEERQPTCPECGNKIHYPHGSRI